VIFRAEHNRLGFLPYTPLILVGHLFQTKVQNGLCVSLCVSRVVNKYSEQQGRQVILLA
jgi:hypothetical protein